MRLSDAFAACATALGLALILTACGPSRSDAPIFTEDHRPQYHFTPATNWMNDPNGMVRAPDGTYHLFFQHNPQGTTWGHMSWGHATSPDLVHWTHRPVALHEEDNEMIFSGSAVYDAQNTSGFGTADNPPLVAIYTSHYTLAEDSVNQAQSLAFSTDGGDTWTKFAGNPVLDHPDPDFRDPKVFWYAPDEKWVMALVLSQQHKVQFYESTNLRDWALLSTFGPTGATGGIWECPDLFELPVEGTDDSRWVLEVDLNPGAVAGGSGGQYFVGSFDGTRFAAEQPSRWIDYGADFYAGVTWANMPERRVFLAWMNNWLYAQDIPTSPWRSAQSLPRTLTLRQDDDRMRLVQTPVQELTQLRGEATRLTDAEIPDGTQSISDRGIRGKAMEIQATFDVGTADSLGLKVRRGDGEETVIGIAPATGEIFVDRSRSGVTDFHPDFAATHAGPVPVGDDGRVTLRVFVDWSSVEVFADGGATAITDRIFPSPSSDGVALFASGGPARLVSLTAWPMASIWNPPEDGGPQARAERSEPGGADRSS